MNIELKLAHKKPCAQIKRQNVFNQEEEQDSDLISRTNKDIVKESLMRQQTDNDTLYRALAEDPTILAYDRFYDSFKQLPIQEDLEKKPKYLDDIKAAVEFNKKERKLIKERVEASNRNKEALLTGESETFITPSYLKFLQESNQWAAELAKKDQVSTQNSVRGAGDFSNFYSKLLTKNSSFGHSKQVGPRKIQKTKDSSSESMADSSETEEVIETRLETVPSNEEKSQVSKTNEAVVVEEKDQASKKSEADISLARERYLQRKTYK